MACLIGWAAAGAGADAGFDANIPTPAQVIGVPIGARPLDDESVRRYLQALDEASPLLQIREYGRTFEDRPLTYLIITSTQNQQRLERLQQQMKRLSDPRGLSAAEAKSILDEMPTFVWLGYGIHGDELSSTDAALEVAYRLVAGTDSSTRIIRDRLVVFIDPMQNPDGRMRILPQLRQWNGAVANTDPSSLQHSGIWPWGRGNHFLFDLNRDFVPMVHPETASRMQAILNWRPQLLIDSHEMGSMDTYLFSPPREPLHPLINDNHKKWWKIFSLDQADAFNRQSWRYYTKDWSENWYPGYADAWVLFNSTVGILYEQAGVDGSAVKQYDGQILTYAEAVEHHVTSSLANIRTAARHAHELLFDYCADRRRAVDSFRQQPYKTFLLDPTHQTGWVHDLAAKLARLQMEVRVAQEIFDLAGTIDSWGDPARTVRFPRGTLFITTDQPAAELLHALADFDPHLKNEFVVSERRELEKFGRSRIYDVTGWSLPVAYSVDAFWSQNVPRVPSIAFDAKQQPPGGISAAGEAFAYLIDYQQVEAAAALTRLLDKGYQVYSAGKPFRMTGHDYMPGSLVLFPRRNSLSLQQDLPAIAAETGVHIDIRSTGLCENGPDLGSQEFRLLKSPRIGLIGNQPVSPNNFGEIWFLLDQVLKIRYSLIDFNRLANQDLSLYNTLIWPSSWLDPQQVQGSLGKTGLTRLHQWIEDGGTLIAIGGSAAALADTSAKFCQTRIRPQVLDKLDLYQREWSRLQAADHPSIDSLTLWSNRPIAKDSLASYPVSKMETKNLKELSNWDQSLLKYRPRGVIVKAVLDSEQWLAFGLRKQIAVMLDTHAVFMARDPVQVPARLANAGELRLSGLLWPEARQRWSQTAYATRESIGKGQLILFVDEPTFRGYFRGSEKLLINAILLGPGFGTAAELLW